VVTPVLDDHDAIGAMMAPAMIPVFTIFTMFTKLGACATIAIAVPDDDGFSTRD